MNFSQRNPTAMTNGFGSSEEEEVLEEAAPDSRPSFKDQRRMRQISTSLIRYKL